VEIGVQTGETTARLCEVAKQTRGKVFGYDFFEPIGEYGPSSISKENVDKMLISRGFENNTFKITKVNTRTEEFSKILKEDTGGKIDFAFIDADHSYNGIKNDFLKVYLLLAEDGMITLHDTYSHIGCRKFVIDLYQELNDGTFDVINFPHGFGSIRAGLTLVAKRSYPLYATNLNFPHYSDGKHIPKEEVYEEEKVWYDKQIKTPCPTQC
jgi:hypothetical protein